jgi:DNA polymerase I-like protein with 3'-5' exonuclease and polymerase domains
VTFSLPWQLWACDFEYYGTDGGGHPVPLCMVARELGTGRLIRQWHGEFGARPPFPVDESAVLIAYNAAAELGCFKALGWPMPAWVLDLSPEFRAETNGLPTAYGKGLLGALDWHHVAGISQAEKDSMRDLILAGGPFTSQERHEILKYCQSDVDELAQLTERMLGRIRRNPKALGQALLRGRYMKSVAGMEHAGVPIDVPLAMAVRERRDVIRKELTREVNARFGVFDEDGRFKTGWLRAMLADREILAGWPRTPKGHVKYDEDTLKDMAKLYPWLHELAETLATLGTLKRNKLVIGPDGRNRTSLWAFTTKTSRNAPKGESIVTQPAWMRGLIKPGPGRSVCYLDWSAQEVWIAAALSGDPALLATVRSGDVYLGLAKRLGLAPEGATKETHGTTRDLFKVITLAISYGMGTKTLASQLGWTTLEARELQRLLARTYPVFYEWSRDAVATGILRGYQSSVFGWTLHASPDTKYTTFKNFPCQANGAEMMRLACILASEAGVQVDVPVHDAIMIEGDTADIADQRAVTTQGMTEAGRIVTGGLEIPVEEHTYSWPDRYMDTKGQPMWDRIMCYM